MKISDDTLAIAFGEDALGGDGIRRRGTSGEHATIPPVRKGRTTMKTISQRVEDAQEALNQARDALTEHVSEDDYDVDAEVALSEAVKAAEDKLASLKRAEAALAAKTADAPRHPAPAARKPLLAKDNAPSRPADLLIRSAVCHLVAKIQGKTLEQVLEARYPDHEETHVVTKADMTIGTTTTSGWASQLVETATADFMELLSPMSVYPRLAARSGRLNFGPNSGAIKVPFESSSPSVSGSFVLEGAPIPVRRIGVDSTTLTPHKMGVISTFSRELAKYSNPQIESLLRRRILRDTAITIDTLLFDTTAGSATRPAGLLNGVSAITASSEGGYQAILDDIAALAAPFDAANAGRDLVLVMNPAQARRLRMQPGPDGTFGWAGTIMDEFAVMSSTSITAGTVIMLDAADFLTAAGDTPEFDVSESAVLHMEDTTPLEIVSGTGPTTADPVRSMFQTATMALRMLLDITWAMPRTGMIQYTTGVTWGDVV
jgi:HK97 family phage major capsid protein